MFFCLPLIFGCPTQVHPDGTQPPRVCPRCHNASVYPAKSKMWFELFFIPVFPMSSRNVWMCSICQWSVPLQPGQWEPAIATSAAFPPGPQGWNSPAQPGYQPVYIQSPQK